MNFRGTLLHQCIYLMLTRPLLAYLCTWNKVPIHHPPQKTNPVYFFFFSSCLPGSCQHTFTLKCVANWQLHKICDVHLILQQTPGSLLPRDRSLQDESYEQRLATRKEKKTDTNSVEKLKRKIF